MTPRILLDNIAITEWVAAKVGIHPIPGIDKSIGIVRQGEIAGGVVFTNFTHTTISMHCAFETPFAMNRDFLWMVFDYPFNQLQVKKVLGFVSSANERALKLDMKLGFQHEATVYEGYSDGDMLILSMRRENCRWLNIIPRGHRRGKEERCA